MNKCDNCIHKEVCKYYPNDGLPKEFRSRMIDQYCDHFADVSEMIKLPCKVGDTVYIVAKCDRFSPQLDGTLYDDDGGFGTATGYYCPYENCCPFETDDCEKVKNDFAVFEDVITRICIEEDIWFVCENSNGYEITDIGKIVFLAKEDALAGLEENHGQ